MNMIGPGLVDNITLASIVADVASVMHDTDTAATVTFVRTGARAFNPATGTVDYTETTTSVSAFVGDIELGPRAPLGAQVGDVKILIAYADLTTAPDTNDRLTIGGKRYAVYASTSGPLSTHFYLFAHRAD